MSLEFFKKYFNLFHLDQLLRTPNYELRTFRPTRRHFLRCLFGLSFFSIFPFHIHKAEAVSPILQKSEGRRSIAEFFKGEELTYQIGAWLFKRVALGRMSFKEMEKKGQYMAVIQAETLGVLGWLARYRVDTYRATMEEIDGGRCLRSLSFEEDVKVGNKFRKKIHFFDYQKRKWTQLRRNKTGTMIKTEVEIPPGMVYDDFLTASYNFRYGVYGEIERGKKYTVPTFPRKGAASYELNITIKEEEQRKRKFEEVKEGKEFFVKLYLDPEITHSKEGLIEGWLSKDLCPLEGVIRDVTLFGDVKGTLIKKVRS